MRTLYATCKALVITLLCISFQAKPSLAQSLIQTPVPGVKLGGSIGGYLQALPLDYATNTTKKYPLMIFMHGIGEVGDGSLAQLPKVAVNGPPKLIANGTFPATFTVNGQTFSFIVISPQFSGWPVPGDIDALYHYLISKYRVDLDRVYITGLSMGGFETWEYTGATAINYAANIAAMVSISGATTPNYAVAQQLVKFKIPIWGLHNLNDPTAPSSYTIQNVDSVIKARNAAIAAGVAVGPAPKLTIFNASGHDAWTKSYDPSYRENNMNVYEWMLSNVRGGSTTPPANQPPVANAGADKTITLPTNSVALAGSGTDADGTISAYSWTKTAGPTQYTISSTTVSNPTISGLVAGTYTFRLTVTDNKGATGFDDINIIVNSAPANVPPVANAGADKTITLPTNSVTLAGSGTDANGTISAYSWTKTAGPTQYTISSTTVSNPTVSGLVAGTYTFRLTVTDNNGATAFDDVNIIVNATAHNISPIANAGPDKTVTLPTNSVVLTGSGTDPDGSIMGYTWTEVSGPAQYTISNNSVSSPTISNLVAGTYTFQLRVTDNQWAVAFDDVNIVVNPASTGGGTTTTTSGKSVKVDIYGGVFPNTDPQWNNWNIGLEGSSNVTSSAFKYSDGTTSTMTANLSNSVAVTDNGATYGSGMAPAAVLRMTSYSTISRTLTIAGLSSAKTYSIELYASRSANSGNSTSFTAGGMTSTVATFDNLTNKAVLTSLVPDATGKIVITINQTLTYNYVNGFTITEGNTTTAVTSKFIKVDVYPGTNPNTDPQWNNWNVSTQNALNFNSGTLKYSDGTASAVSALLSQSVALADNGASYTGSMAPSPVLRYATYSTIARTLTFSGLSTSKNYDIELYASRNLNTGNGTIFSIGTLSSTISTYDNMTNKAAFAGIAPDATGKIVINIGETATYNYLNGFMITEGSTATTASVNASTLVTETAEATAEEPGILSNESAIIKVFPNPIRDAFELQVNNDQTGNMRIQVIDISGIVRKDFVVTKNQNWFNQNISINNLAAGTYIVRVQINHWVQTMKILKL